LFWDNGVEPCPREKLKKVTYGTDRVLAKLDHASTIDRQLLDVLLLTKSKGWVYEREWRRFVPLSDAMAEGRLHFFPFGPTMKLAEVVLGPHCDTGVDAVRRLVASKYPEAVTYKSRLAYGSFKVVPDEDTVP
jgi:hypothetical protein